MFQRHSQKKKKKHLAIEDTRKGRIWIQAAYRGKNERQETKEPIELWDQEKR